METDEGRPRAAYVLGVDPGTTTGLSVVRFDVEDQGKPSLAWFGQFPWDMACDRLADRLRLMNVLKGREPASSFTAVGEKFTINSKSAQRGQMYIEDSMGMLGVLRREARLAGVPTAPLQQASAVKRLVSDLVLKMMHLHRPGLKHANDATRHAVACAHSLGLMHPVLLARGLA